jgi:hypothetical protein
LNIFTCFTLNFDVSRRQHLGGDWSASGRFAGQAATTNLDTPQKFFIGGPFSVPGYPVGEMRGDFRANVQADVRYDIRSIPWSGDLQVSTFATPGWIRLYQATRDGWQGENRIISNDVKLHWVAANCLHSNSWQCQHHHSASGQGSGTNGGSSSPSRYS